MATSASTYERLGTVSLHIVLHARGKIIAHGASVSTGGLRMRTFRADGPEPRCSCCGLKATHFAVERHKGTTGGYHLNLWGIGKHGNEVLFTHDHTLARALGGVNHTTNTTTMCSPCNSKKSREEHRAVLKLRGEHVDEKDKQAAREQRALRRQEKIANRMASDPEYAARVAFHQQRTANMRGVQAVISS